MIRYEYPDFEIIKFEYEEIMISGGTGTVDADGDGIIEGNGDGSGLDPKSGGFGN